MKCITCNREMEFVTCNDDPGEGYVYNVYHCLGCMMLAKENVWNDPGVTWINMLNKVIFVPSKGEERGTSNPT